MKHWPGDRSPGLFAKQPKNQEERKQDNMAKQPKNQEDALPVNQSFTTRDRGATVVIYQRPETERHPRTGDIIPGTSKRSITVRLQRGVEFDPFKECGQTGKQKAFRDVEPQKMHDFLMEQVKTPENAVCLWAERPMSEEQKEGEVKLRAALKHGKEQEQQNEALRELIKNAGLKVPEDLA